MLRKAMKKKDVVLARERLQRRTIMRFKRKIIRSMITVIMDRIHKLSSDNSLYTSNNF